MQAAKDGDSYRVTGTKIWTSLAQHADWMLLLARTSTEERKQQGITFLCVSMDTPGIEVHPIISIDGRHSLNRVTFDDVVIQVENRIGSEGEGWHYANFLFRGLRCTTYVDADGAISRFAFHHSIGNSLSPRMSGVSLNTHPASTARTDGCSVSSVVNATSNSCRARLRPTHICAPPPKVSGLVLVKSR